MKIAYILAAAVALAGLTGGPALAQYAPTDPTHDHTWTPNNGGFSLGIAGVPSTGHGSPAGASSTWTDGGGTVDPQPPKPPETAYNWKYWVYFTQTKHTAGFVVNWVTTNCFDAANTQVDDSLCAGKPGYSPGQCSFNGYGFGECDTTAQWAGSYRQTTYSTYKGNWFD